MGAEWVQHSTVYEGNLLSRQQAVIFAAFLSFPNVACLVTKMFSESMQSLNEDYL